MFQGAIEGVFRGAIEGVFKGLIYSRHFQCCSDGEEKYWREVEQREKRRMEEKCWESWLLLTEPSDSEDTYVGRRRGWERQRDADYN